MRNGSGSVLPKASITVSAAQLRKREAELLYEALGTWLTVPNGLSSAFRRLREEATNMKVACEHSSF